MVLISPQNLIVFIDGDIRGEDSKRNYTKFNHKCSERVLSVGVYLHVDLDLDPDMDRFMDCTHDAQVYVKLSECVQHIY